MAYNHINRILSPFPDYNSAHSNSCNILVFSAYWITKVKWLLSLNTQTEKRKKWQNHNTSLLPWGKELWNSREQKLILESYPLLFLVIMRLDKAAMNYWINQWAWSRDERYASSKKVVCYQYLKPKWLNIFYQFSGYLLDLEIDSVLKNTVLNL